MRSKEALAEWPYGELAAYAAAGVTRFAAWVHETDHAMRGDLEVRGYTVQTTTHDEDEE